MKLSFDKIEKGELIKKNTSESRQEDFDRQCLEEAEKLRFNIDDLKSEIEKHGGVEKFKQIFEEKVYETNVAGKKLDGLEKEKSLHDMNAKITGLQSIIVGMGTVLTVLGIRNFEVMTKLPDSNNELVDTVKNLSIILAVGLEIAAFISLVFTTFRERHEARDLKRASDTENLKYKMTGIESKSSSNL